MRAPGRSYLVSISVLIGFVALLSSGCKDHCYDGEKNQDEDGLDCGGASCIPCDSALLIPPEETCFDGIQNQDETGVDCGGSVCLPCSNDTTQNQPDPAQLCDGNGTTDLLPLAVGNYWSYLMNGAIPFTLTITSTASLQGQTYHRVEASGPYPYSVEYLRNDGAGNIYRLEADGGGNPVGAEYLYLDATGTAGTGWNVLGVTVDSLSTASLGTAINSANGCSYTNVATFKDFSGTTNLIQRSYQPGIGVVDWQFSGGISSAYLDSVALY